MKLLRVMLLIFLFLPASCWAVVGQMTKLGDDQMGLENRVNRGELCGLQIGIFNTVSNSWGWPRDYDVIVNGVQLGIINSVTAANGNVLGVFCQIGLLNIMECGGAMSYLPLLRVRW